MRKLKRSFCKLFHKYLSLSISPLSLSVSIHWLFFLYDISAQVQLVGFCRSAIGLLSCVLWHKPWELGLGPFLSFALTAIWLQIGVTCGRLVVVPLTLSCASWAGLICLPLESILRIRSVWLIRLFKCGCCNWAIAATVQRICRTYPIKRNSLNPLPLPPSGLFTHTPAYKHIKCQ